MCGFAGILHMGSAAHATAPGAVARAMADTLSHRGPDDFDVWQDADAGIGLGFRRLSILDLTAAGAQPMASACGRYVIAYNGEIYNHQALHADLARLGDTVWRGHSDTEVLLAAISRWGVSETLSRVDGMFAFALWDKQARRITLARDPFGEKPLYYGVQNGAVVFGSELKAIMAAPGFKAKMNPHATTLFLRHRYVPAPHSILDGIYKLPAGHQVSVAAGDAGLGEPSPYWDSFTEAVKAQQTPFSGSFEDAVEALDGILRQSVAERRVADVPVGVFLSGGIDSSLIAALMCRDGRDVQSYTIGFSEDHFDESPHARAVAQHLGTKHTETILSQDDALALVPELADIYDEPFADASQIPTTLLARSAASHVKVALSGDGGDEMFLGYTRYWEVPELAARNAGRSSFLNGVAGGLGPCLPFRWRRKLQNTTETNVERLYEWRTCAWRSGLPVRDPALKALSAFETPFAGEGLGLAQRLALRDSAHALPDDLQVKIDRASMSASLETRAPLLSRRVARFAWSLPESFNIKAGDGGKRVLRHVLHRYVPSNLVERPKAGFEPPVRIWLKGALREWADDLLSEPSEFLDTPSIRRAWDQHLSGRGREGDLWPVLMLAAWRRRWGV